MPKKIDPLNSKHYGAISIALTVADMKAAAKFYQQAFGFLKRKHERSQWQADTYGAGTPHRSDAGAGGR